MSRPVAIVTGAAGFIGSHLAERLVADGHDVIGIDRAAGDHLAGLRADPSFTLVEHDLTRPLVLPAGTVFHLAGRPGVRGTDPVPYVNDNVVATRNVLAAAGPRRVVFAGSSSVYGPAADRPSHEGDAPAPITHYARTKLAAERLVLDHPGGLALRYFSVYGPRQRPDMAFARFIRAAEEGAPAPLHQSGLAARDFTYVGDVVDATVRAARGGRSGAIYNVGAGTPVPLAEALQLLALELRRPVPCEPAVSPVREADRTWADAARARDELGWSARTTLAVGLKSQVAQRTTKVAVRAG
jgi:nucleoside-diphosphate-sugar epimerase